MLTRSWLLLLFSFAVAEWLWGKSVAIRPLQIPAALPHVPSIEERIVREATLQGLPSHVAVNLAWSESRFKEKLVSRTHDYGVMQLNRYFFPAAPNMTTDQNIHAGVELLSKYWERSHSEALTVNAYRHGPSVLRGITADRTGRFGKLAHP
jgi:Transglycosylase SLT domain